MKLTYGQLQLFRKALHHTVLFLAALVFVSFLTLNSGTTFWVSELLFLYSFLLYPLLFATIVDVIFTVIVRIHEVQEHADPSNLVEQQNLIILGASIAVSLILTILFAVL